MDGLAFYGITLSSNMAETPEGYLICRNAVIGRTGVQLYRRAQLPAAEAQDLGIGGNAEDLVEVHREAEDVFDPAFIASLEGKPITDGHPPELLTIDTADKHRCGHMQNVRPGSTALDGGDMPLCADLMITSKGLKSKILSGLRQLSCGYTYHIALDGDRILQVEMTGNHAAVLRNGRAGPGARIYDGDDTETTPMKIIETLRAASAKWWADHGATATPEERRAAASAAVALDGNEADVMKRLSLTPDSSETNRGTRRRTEKLSKDDRLKKAFADATAAIDEGEDPDDVREKLHDTLDEILDKKDGDTAAAAEAEAAAKEELKELLEEATGDDDDDDEGKAKDGADDDEGESLRNLAARALDGLEDDDEDRDGMILPLDAGRRRGTKAEDEGVRLRKLRPVVEKSKDRKLRAAFDAAVEAYNTKRRRQRVAERAGEGNDVRGVRREGAGYASFGRASMKHPGMDEGTDPNAELQRAYDLKHPHRSQAVKAREERERNK